MANNTNTAYDFSKFEVAPAPREKLPLRVVSTPRTKRRPKVFGLSKLCLVALMVSMVVYMIYNQVVLSELSGQVSLASANLTELESENTRLSADLASNSSYKTLEEYATYQLGLSKLDSGQIIYMDMQQSDRIEITGKRPEQTGLEKIVDTLSGILKHIGVE